MCSPQRLRGSPIASPSTSNKRFISSCAHKIATTPRKRSDTMPKKAPPDLDTGVDERTKQIDEYVTKAEDKSKRLIEVLEAGIGLMETLRRGHFAKLKRPGTLAVANQSANPERDRTNAAERVTDTSKSQKKLRKVSDNFDQLKNL